MDDMLISVSEPEFALFQSRIVSDTHCPRLGVRMPVLRRLAKQASQEQLPLVYFERVLLKGLSIAYVQ